MSAARRGRASRLAVRVLKDARYFAGFVGWQSGELAADLGKGWWYAAEPDKSTVFDRRPEELWETLVKRPPPPEGMQAT